MADAAVTASSESANEKSAQKQLQQYINDLTLDETKLKTSVASDQAEVFLLQWLAKVEKTLATAPEATLLDRQSALASSLLSLICPPPANDSSAPSTPVTPASSKDGPSTTTLPRPGKLTRQLIARCLVTLFRRAESRPLFDTLQTCIRTVNDDTKGKVPEKEYKVAALYVVGELFAALGQNVMSLFADITTTAQRVAKNTSFPVILRFHALSCLQKALIVGGKSLNDQPGKEMIKALRALLTDKAGAVIRGAAECLCVLSAETDLLASRSEIEALLSAAFKSLETADFVTKRALARLTATLLAFTQKENSAPAPVAPKTQKKKKKDGAGDDSEEEEVAAQQAASAAIAAGGGTTLFRPQEVLSQVSEHMNKNTSSRKFRTALLDVYATLFTSLGASWVQTHYDLIIKHMLEDLPNTPRSRSSRAEVLSLRTGLSIIMRRVIGERMLGEGAQVNAVQEICESYIRRFPVVMPGQPPAPTKYTLVPALDEVSGLLRQLGTVPPQVADALYDSLLRCLAHPSHSVQVSAAWCLRVYCTVSPSQLTTTIDKVVSLLTKDLETLNNSGERSGADLPRRTNGHARGLAALISVIPSRPLYTSFDVSSKVFDLAVGLLKNCGNHPLPISGVEIQVAWTLLSSLMALGPSFVRLHLNQLLLLWRNALPKPTSKDMAPAGQSTRSDGEWAFLLHVRECTLSCILAFLHHNIDGLLNLDTARRIVALLSNALAFVDGFTQSHSYLAQEQVPGHERSSLSLLDREHMLRRRIFQSFSLLASNAAMEPLQDSLVPVALQAFAEPDRYVGSAAQAAIAAGAGTFTTLWAVPDGYAYGVTSLQRDDESFVAQDDNTSLRMFPATHVTAKPDQLNRDPIEVQIDALQRRPVLGAAEHDPLVLYSRYDAVTDSPPLSPPPATALVDAALELFASLVPFQTRDVQIAAFETMLAYSRSIKTEKNPGRRAAIHVNCCVAALGALKVTMQGTPGIGGKRAGGYNNDRLTTALRELFKDALLLGDSVLRAISSQSYGRLAAVAGSHAMSSQVQFLVDQVVTNRDPDARAGCALAFGTIYSEVGGLSAGPLTKTVVNVLMSLSSDPHPTVHNSALQALRLVVEAASLSYSPFVASTLGMLVKLCVADTHEPEGGSVGSANLRADLPAPQAICRVIGALIGVLGPDLREPGKVPDLIQILLNESSRDTDDGVVVEATKALRQFSLFAPQKLDMQDWIAQLTEHLRSRKRPRKVAAITGLYQLVQRQALLVSKIAGDGLVAELFAQLDLDPGIDGVREVLLSWLRQTAELSPSSWIDICQRIMSRSSGKANQATAKKTNAPAPGQLQDEEAATLDLGDDGASNSVLSQGSRWRTQLFALQCLHQTFLVVRQSGKLEHFHAPSQGLAPQQARALMSSRVGDLIRMAFTASTAPNTEIRLEGLTVLRDVIENFKTARDPDFEEALMLEQHQAPIAAALTPAFAVDSTPEVLAAAIQVCAVFVGSGVIREVDKMGRILKQLITALDSCQNPDMNALGDAKDLSPNAAGMLKVAVFTAWSELQVATTSQGYLVQVIKPHINVLAPYWVASLREYAKMKIDPEGVSAGLGLASVGVVVNPSLESQYAGLSREVLMPHYEQTWHQMIQAVSVLLNIGHPSIMKAMDGLPVTKEEGDSVAVNDSSFRSEPTAFFFVLYGLAFEALTNGAGSSSPVANEALRGSRTMSIALGLIKALAKPQYSGTALLQDGIFEELCNLCFKIVLTESTAVQSGVVELVAALATNFNSRLLDGDDEKDGVDSRKASLPPNAKLTQLLRVVVSVINRSRIQRGPANEGASLLRSAFEAYNGIAGLYSAVIQEDLFSSAFHLYSELLRDESDVDLVSPTLSSLKDLCEKSSQGAEAQPNAVSRAVHGFVSFALNAIDGMRGRTGAVVLRKTKDCLLASTVVLTSVAPKMKISQAVLEQMAYTINQKISAVVKTRPDATIPAADLDIGLTSANCARSLLVASGRGNPALQYCAGQLLPGLVELVVTFQQGSQDRKDVRVVVMAEVLKALEGFSTALPDGHALRTLSILLPTYLVLVPSDAETSMLGSLATEHLLSLASKHASGFRETMARLSTADRTKLEAGIRSAVATRNQGGRGGMSGTANAPRGGDRGTIALKSFGS